MKLYCETMPYLRFIQAPEQFPCPQVHTRSFIEDHPHHFADKDMLEVEIKQVREVEVIPPNTKTMIRTVKVVS